MKRLVLSPATLDTMSQIKEAQLVIADSIGALDSVHLVSTWQNEQVAKALNILESLDDDLDKSYQGRYQQAESEGEK